MNIGSIDAVLAVTRAALRGPLVTLRLLAETPAAWAPALAAVLLLAFAWWQDRREQPGHRGPRTVELAAGLFGLGILAWLFHLGQFPWTEGDWREEWTFFVAWKQALRSGGLPYHLAAAMQGTERYLANLQTPLMPYVIALRFVDVSGFVLFHLAFVFAVGFMGAVALRRELGLRLLPWTVFLLVFTLNGHIVSHLSVGHLPWAAYFLIPWMLLSAIRTARGDRSWRMVLICAATFGAMILIGGWHVFVWSLLFMAFSCLLSRQRISALLWIGVITALLAAARLAPAVATFGTGANTFISGYPTVVSMLAALVTSPIRDARLEPWELDAFVGFGGFLLLCLGAIPFREPATRFMNVLLLPTALLLILSLGNVYQHTLFRLPGFVSERVTTRLIILPVLWLALAGAVRLDAWWRRARFSLATAVPVLLGAWFAAMQLILRAQVWRPHAGSALDALPGEVLKTAAAEPSYFWAFWCGAAISSITAVAVARMLATRVSSCSPSGTDPTRAFPY